jgi:hypothetical protein
MGTYESKVVVVGLSRPARQWSVVLGSCYPTPSDFGFLLRLVASLAANDGREATGTIEKRQRRNICDGGFSYAVKQRARTAGRDALTLPMKGQFGARRT